MIHKTHSVTGLLAAELVLLYSHQPILSWETPVALACGYFAGILADADQPQSVAGQKVWILALALRGFHVRHRTLTHSILFMASLWFILSLFPIPPIIKWAFLAGYASHPFIDLFNEQGVELFYPWTKRIKLLPYPLGIGVDSAGEGIFRLGVYVLNFFMLVTLLEPILKFVPYIGAYGREIAITTTALLPFFK